jgi:hypothetical protein
MMGADVILALRRKLQVKTDRALASRLGVTEVSLHYWKKSSSITPLQIANLIHSARMAATKSFQVTAIRPLVEFFKIQECDSRGGAKHELFSVEDELGNLHPYRAGLRDELDKYHGVYIFFDSRGQAIYTGKAKSQTLWREMKSAFNRNRDSVQKIKRVRHPESRVSYRTSNEKSRQIKEYSVPLYELAAYFSAYYVDGGMINELESLLVRSFANDLLNIRMERFSKQPKGKR